MIRLMKIIILAIACSFAAAITSLNAWNWVPNGAAQSPGVSSFGQEPWPDSVREVRLARRRRHELRRWPLLPSESLVD
jgi:hypothetical protein